MQCSYRRWYNRNIWLSGDDHQGLQTSDPAEDERKDLLVPVTTGAEDEAEVDEVSTEKSDPGDRDPRDDEDPGETDPRLLLDGHRWAAEVNMKSGSECPDWA